MNKRRKKKIEDIVEDVMRKRTLRNCIEGTKESGNVVKYAQGRISWTDRAIKECYSWVVKILKGKGPGGSDRLGLVEAPLPDEVKDYLENQEIDLQLNHRRETND